MAILRQLSFPYPAGFGAAEAFYRTLERKLNSGEGTLLGQAKTDAVGAGIVGHHQARTELVASVNAQVLRKRPPNRIGGGDKVAIPANLVA
jgi:hypothetical protein